VTSFAKFALSCGLVFDWKPVSENDTAILEQRAIELGCDLYPGDENLMALLSFAGAFKGENLCQTKR
jgi:hypothetical protein